MRAFVLFVLATVTVCAQKPSIAGLETPWDARRIVTQLQQDTDKLKPVLTKLNPQRWYDEKGAPSTYILGLQTGQQELRDVDTTLQQLQTKVESLPVALDVYFRLEALQVTLGSLNEGAQRYGDRATAQELARFIAQNFNDRERFRDYIKDLATSAEQNFKIADEEAQRCRGIIGQQAPPQKMRKK